MSYDQTESYRHTQASASTSWVIAHNLGTSAPVVDVWVDEGGDTVKIMPLSVDVDSANQVTLTFSTAKSGEAIVV